jgi:hypothetical protein
MIYEVNLTNHAHSLEKETSRRKGFSLADVIVAAVTLGAVTAGIHTFMSATVETQMAVSEAGQADTVRSFQQTAMSFGFNLNRTGTGALSDLVVSSGTNSVVGGANIFTPSVLAEKHVTEMYLSNNSGSLKVLGLWAESLEDGYRAPMFGQLIEINSEQPPAPALGALIPPNLVYLNQEGHAVTPPFRMEDFPIQVVPVLPADNPPGTLYLYSVDGVPVTAETGTAFFGSISYGAYTFPSRVDVIAVYQGQTSAASTSYLSAKLSLDPLDIVRNSGITDHLWTFGHLKDDYYVLKTGILPDAGNAPAPTPAGAAPFVLSYGYNGPASANTGENTVVPAMPPTRPFWAGEARHLTLQLRVNDALEPSVRDALHARYTNSDQITLALTPVATALAAPLFIRPSGDEIPATDPVVASAVSAAALKWETDGVIELQVARLESSVVWGSKVTLNVTTFQTTASVMPYGSQ